MSSISEDRKTILYRFLEGSIGFFSIGFLIFLLILSFIAPTVLAIFLIIYSFLMVLKTSLHGMYTIYTYKNLLRWEKVNWPDLVDKISKNKTQAIDELEKLRDKFAGKIDWQNRLNADIAEIKNNLQSKFNQPNQIFHIPIFAVYNESSEVISRSLKAIFDSGYDLSRICVFISQEGRCSENFNQKIRKNIESLSWTNCTNTSETDLEKVYTQKHLSLEYFDRKFANFKLYKNKLNIVFTQHPDGLIGEIKGKASNEDWGARQASLFIKSRQIDPELVIVTSLDADSRVGDNFFFMLSYKYCVTPDRLSAGFQPLPIYTNNFFSVNLFPRLVATNTTIWYMIQSSLLDELHFFANYCVPLKVLQTADFWNREVIAEDSLLFAKCFVAFEGKFRVVPFYGTFEGDAVEGDDYFETIVNQYKQLQRWAWGGIEGFPYKFKKFFLEKSGQKIDLRKRINSIRLEFMNHFFWSTLPIIFSLMVFLPQLFGGQNYRESTLQLNLWLFSQYFAWLSFIFLAISSYITFRYIASKATKYIQVRWFHWLLITMQWIISPLIFVIMGPPAIDVQIRGILGKYLGYWVTPKK